MTEREEQRVDHEPDSRRVRVALTLAALACLGTLAFVIVREGRSDAAWRLHQQRYAKLQVGEGGPLQPRVRELYAAGAVDRCPTCHLAAADPQAKASAEQQPLRRHPGELLRQHPPGRFRCTSCHEAGGVYVDRCLPSMSKRDLVTAERALPGAMAQAACRRCHGATSEHLPGAAIYTAGRQAYRRLGCGSCHRSALEPKGKPPRRIGPPLDELTHKLRPSFARSLLEDPQKTRPGTAMPSYFSADALAGAPAFTRVRVQAQQQEMVLALMALLYSSAPSPGAQVAPVGDAAAGARRFKTRGCVACHSSCKTSDAPGPNLSQAGARLQRAWLHRWLAGPAGYNPETLMPDPRLTAVERADLVEHLAGLGAPKKDAPPLPRPHPARVAQGQEIAARLGCHGCHAIKSLDKAPLAGPDLDGFGDKPAALLDWGHARSVPPTKRTARRWTELKLRQPLAFDWPPGVLLMPRQKLRGGEAQGLVVLLRSLDAADDDGHHRATARTSWRSERLRHGERLVRRLGCRRCHRLGSLVSGKNEPGLQAPVESSLTETWDRPPALDGQGAKVLPSWLDGYLRRPVALRPWLTLRMPRFNLEPRRRVALVAALAARDGASYPFAAQPPLTLTGPALEQALQLFERLRCVSCHQLSNAGKLKPGELAPDLALGGGRLRRRWIRRFLLEPQQLMPGTRMPTLFPLADEDDPNSRTSPEPKLLGGAINKQIEALTDLSLWWGSAAAARRAR
jgi:cytochrome c2